MHDPSTHQHNPCSVILSDSDFDSDFDSDSDSDSDSDFDSEV